MRQSFTDFTNRQVGGSCAIAHSRRTGVKLPEEIINQFLCKCEIDVSSKYQNMVKEIAEQYVRELFDNGD